MESSKITKMIIVLITVFILSFIYAVIDSFPTFSSAYDLGKTTGQTFKNMIKILGMLGLVVFVFRYFKK